MNLKTKKAELRKSFRAGRKAFISSEGAAAQRELKAHMERFVKDFAPGGVQFCAYHPLAEEAHFSLAPITQFFFPRLQGEKLEFIKPQSPEAFEPGPYGIQEPVEGEKLSAQHPTVVFCPAVAVDAQGARLGMGKGYYDRFFQDHPNAIRVGVVYQVQLSAEPLPAESWDQPLDWIITDKMILRTSNRSSDTWT